MDQTILLIRKPSGEILLEGQYPRSVGQVIIKALLVGRRNFSYPVPAVSADAALREFSKWFLKVQDKIRVGCSLSAVGTRYEAGVYEAVLKILHLDRNVFSAEFFGVLQLNG